MHKDTASDTPFIDPEPILAHMRRIDMSKPSWAALAKRKGKEVQKSIDRMAAFAAKKPDSKVAAICNAKVAAWQEQLDDILQYGA